MQDPAPRRFLLVEDDEDDFLFFREVLSETEIGSPQIEWANTYDVAKDALCSQSFDVCVVDYKIGAKTGIDFIGEARAAGFNMPMILLTGVASHDIDVEASKSGASDFLDKTSMTPKMLERSIRYAQANAKQTQALEHRTTLLRATLEHTSAGIATFGSQLQLEACNNRLLEILRLCDGCADESAADGGPSADLKALGGPILDILEAYPFTEDIQFEVGLQDGRTIEVRHQLAPGNRHVVVCLDVTDRKALELELVESRDMVVKESKEKLDLIANFARQLQTPLEEFTRFAEMVKGREKTASEASVLKESAESLLGSDEMITSILEDILELASADSDLSDSRSSSASADSPDSGDATETEGSLL